MSTPDDPRIEFLQAMIREAEANPKFDARCNNAATLAKIVGWLDRWQMDKEDVERGAQREAQR